MGHADEVNTDVDTKRVHAGERDGVVSIAWDYPGRTLLEVRILRSDCAFAAGPEPTPDQQVVYEGAAGSFRGGSPAEGVTHHYTVFARHPGEEWRRWAEFASRPRRRTAGPSVLHRLLGWRKRCLALVVTAFCVAAVAAAAPGYVAAAEEPQDDAVAAAARQALEAATADPIVAAVLGDAAVDPSHRIVMWSNGAGATVFFEWPANGATRIDGVWPLVKTDGSDELPVAPYVAYERRLRMDDLTGLRVDVLLDDPRVIQIAPQDAATTFVLHEQTWAPFSWIPWFTERPWVLVPPLVALAALVIWRAWLRSRAWNRRSPSLTRHDRQFIGRLTVLIFFIAGFAWLIWEGVVAATSPSADPAAAAGDLASLPLLLIPPGLFLAALVLELSWQAHRVAWGLLALLAAAGSAYYLAAAMTGTASNLNLSSHILLAVLALVAIPRAFSRGKMGWSRSFSPHYG